MRFTTVILLFLTLLIVSGCVSGGKYKMLEREREDLMATRDTLSTRVDKLVLEVKRLDKALAETRDLLKKEVAQKTADLNQATEERNKLQRLLDELNQKQAEYDQKMKDLQIQKALLDEKNAALLAQTSEYDKKILDLKAKQDMYEGIVRDMNKEQERYAALMASLKSELNAKSVKIESLEGKLTVTFVNEVLFESGSASISEQGKSILSDFAKGMVNNKGFKINVLGHTDNQQITGNLAKIYPSNWELSTARSLAVVRYLIEKCNMDPAYLYPIGRSYFAPVAGNDTADGRSRNRRVEIVILPTAGQQTATQK